MQQLGESITRDTPTNIPHVRSNCDLKNNAPRFIKGFQRYDKVLFNNIECFVFGRRATGYFDIRTLGGTKLSASAKVKELKLIESFSTLLTERRHFLPVLKDGVSTSNWG